MKISSFIIMLVLLTAAIFLSFHAGAREPERISYGEAISSSNDQLLTSVSIISGEETLTGTNTPADPVTPPDSATKAYIDDILAAFGIALPGNYSGTITDIDGNRYRTVKIGTQTWMAENLRAGRYNDGTAIPFVTDNSIWSALTSPGYCWYDNELANNTTYGALYNWYAVAPAGNGGKNLCPAGWHVPSDKEWTTLTTYLGGISIAGGKLKEAGTVHWKGTDIETTNKSGFAALPGGHINRGGIFSNIGFIGSWWSETVDYTNYAWFRRIYYFNSYIGRSSSIMKNGFSVRCLKDDD